MEQSKQSDNSSQQREQQFIEQLKKIPVSDRAQFLAEARAIVAKAKSNGNK